VFCGEKQNRSGRLTTGAIEILFKPVGLANLGAEKLAVALEAHFSASQKISHCRDRFFRVFGAGTNRENQVAKRKFRAGF
jgi:hypothetical protein